MTSASRSPCHDVTAEAGDFYVEPGCCLLCGVPETIAPEIFHTGEHYCSIVRQPCSQDEIDRTIHAMWSSEVDCVRYRGSDAAMLERLAQAGMAELADRRQSLKTPVRFRDRVIFKVPTGSGLTNSTRVAGAFRTDMRAKGLKVLPALLGKRSAWVSWYKNHFHLICFADAEQGQFVARLRFTTALQGLAWRVDDWLREQSAENIRWETTNDPMSGRLTPM